MTTTTRTLARTLAPALALGLLGSAGCRREDSGITDRTATQQTPARALEQAQREAEGAYERAKQAQGTAREQTGDVQEADRAVADKRQELAEAEQKAARERLEAQAAQSQAQAQGAVAQQQAQSAQTRAAQAQQQQAQDAARDARTISPAGVDTPATVGTTATADTWGAETTAIGTVETASTSQVVIRREAGKMMTLEVAPGTTTVIQNGQPATVGALTAGTKVKVSYRLERDHQTPTALRIEASGNRDEG